MKTILRICVQACVPVLFLAATAGCGGPEGDAPSGSPPVPLADPPAAGDEREAAETVVRTGPFERTFGSIAFSVPAGWEEVEPAPGQTGFIDARFLVPAGGTDVELTVSSVGGGIEANLERWIGQFQRPAGTPPPRIEPLRIDGIEASWIDLRGTFTARSSGRPGPHHDWRMLGAGIPSPPRDIYLKLNGPQEAVAEVHDEFRRFVRSARPQGHGP